MLNIFKLFKRVKNCEERLDSIGPLVTEYNTKALMPLKEAVGVLVKTESCWERNYMIYFVKGTEPKCDFAKIKDGKLIYYKMIPATSIEVNADGSPLKVAKKKK